ncbi:hypothetical protein OAT55_01215 [Flavobacteriaceae bacterium]|nr:hypothetical protein [Flavobacteriaceae bacterium]
MKFFKPFIVLMLFFGLIYVVNNYTDSNLSDPAMMGETFDVIAKNKDGKQIHLIDLDSNLVKNVISTIDNNKKTIFILGNSQTQSVNQLKNNQSNLIELVSFALPEYNVISHTMPNMNLQEFWLSFSYWNSKISIDKVIIPVFFDDFRENQVRSHFIDYAANENFLINEKDLISKKINNKISNENKSENAQNIGQILEIKILDLLNNNFYFWQSRTTIKTNIFVGLYNLRNTIFNIKPTSKRKVIKSSFKNNLKSLINILKFTDESKISAYLYIPPIRQDYEIPYDLNEYINFKKQMRDTILNFNGNFKNFETIVPPKLWGNKQSTNLSKKTEIDFMHFRFEGHKILSDSLSKFVK